MAEELTYKEEAATGYNRAFARVAKHFLPFLLRATHITPGMRSPFAARLPAARHRVIE
jgi:hypothetical protein